LQDLAADCAARLLRLPAAKQVVTPTGVL
jgi:hypothetical protein